MLLFVTGFYIFLCCMYQTFLYYFSCMLIQVQGALQTPADMEDVWICLDIILINVYVIEDTQDETVLKVNKDIST